MMKHYGFACGLGKIFWVFAAIALILAWMSSTAPVMGIDAVTWYWNALILGVLAIPLKAMCHMK